MPRIEPTTSGSPRASIHRAASQPNFPTRSSLLVRCAILWNSLRKLRLSTQQTFLDNVGENVKGVDCPEDTAVPVYIGGPESQKPKRYIHANQIEFAHQRACSAAGNQAEPIKRIAFAGQSPQSFELCQRFLIQGIESGNGLFQFVSRKAHAHTKDSSNEHSKERSILDQLLTVWNAKKFATITLADRFCIFSLEKITTDEASDHCCYKLFCRDYKTTQLKTVLITQVGLKFTNSVLKGQEIQRASELMDSHKQRQHNFSVELHVLDQKQAPRPPDTQSDPMAISYAGIGRNATLIAYREALARPDDDTDVALANIISRGRRDRGRHFVHSEAQLRELQFAVDMAKNPIRPARPTVEQLAARAPIP